MKKIVQEIEKKSPALNYTASLHRDLRRLHSWIRSSAYASELPVLQLPSGLRSMLSIGTDWVLIFGAISAAWFISPWLIPAALLIVGSRQRALANIRHDAAHYNLFKSRIANDLVTDHLGAFAMFETVRFYREGHNLHHKYLGLNSHDPDAANHVFYGVDDAAHAVTTPAGKFMNLFLNRHSIFDSLGKSFWEITVLERVKVVVWWAALLVLLTLLSSKSFAIFFVALWMSSRATTYHAVRIFAEFLDHSGLTPGSTIGFTRTLPKKGIVAALVSPHADYYHLAHHLFPKIPHYNLGRLHSLLLLNPEYQAAHHCDSYFFGRHPATKCWVGRCDEVAT